MRTLALVLVLAGCGAHVTYREWELGFGERIACRDADCREVTDHVAAMRAPRGAYVSGLRGLMRMGERAVPTLRRELDAEAALDVRNAAIALIALGHGDEVVAWCRTIGSDDERGVACIDDEHRVDSRRGDRVVYAEPQATRRVSD